ncbi:MAG: flagellar motor protein MotB [Fidelibacterota bacterium]|nr:MAG: flagellar motor protein MotB [Candidatus Neomarinimicrobiota bacterium]
MITTHTTGSALRLGLVAVLITAGLVGCVSKNKFDEKAELAEKLRTKAAELNKRNQQLATRVQFLESEILRISGQKGYAEARMDSALKAASSKQQRLQQLYDELSKKLTDEIARGEITITELRNKLTVNIMDQILFLSGETEVRQKGQAVLDRIGVILKTVKRQRIQIAGHTDNVPVGEKLQHRYATNWELSTARATTVTRLLIEKYSADPKLVSAAGFAEYKPVASNETKEGRAKNRRIEIVLTPM